VYIIIIITTTNTTRLLLSLRNKFFLYLLRLSTVFASVHYSVVHCIPYVLHTALLPLIFIKIILKIIIIMLTYYSITQSKLSSAI